MLIKYYIITQIFAIHTYYIKFSSYFLSKSRLLTVYCRESQNKVTYAKR